MFGGWDAPFDSVYEQGAGEADLGLEGRVDLLAIDQWGWRVVVRGCVYEVKVSGGSVTGEGECGFLWLLAMVRESWGVGEYLRVEEGQGGSLLQHRGFPRTNTLHNV